MGASHRFRLAAACALQLLACCGDDSAPSDAGAGDGGDAGLDAQMPPPTTSDAAASDAQDVDGDAMPIDPIALDGGVDDARVAFDAAADAMPIDPIALDGGVDDARVAFDAAAADTSVPDACDAAAPVDASEPDATIPQPDATIPQPDATIPDPAECTPWTALVEPDNVICEQEPPPDVGPFQLQVALTFDDGPNPVTTPSVLEILRNEAIPATFFMVGQRLQTEQNRALAREIHDDPLFRVSNHTFTHARLPTLERAAVEQQIDTTSAAIRTALEDPCYFPRFVRFPYSDSDCDTMDVVRERGFAAAGLHIDSMDWCFANAGNPGYCPPELEETVPDAYRNDMIGYVIHQLQAYDGGIVLLHDIHQNTANNLQALIDALREEDVTFVALDDEDVFPLLNAQLEVPAPPACCQGVTR